MTEVKRNRKPSVVRKFESLETVTKPVLSTEELAFYLNRRPQTIRGWACFKNGPIEPIHILNRLAWKTSDVKRLCGIEQ